MTLNPKDYEFEYRGVKGRMWIPQVGESFGIQVLGMGVGGTWGTELTLPSTLPYFDDGHTISRKELMDVGDPETYLKKDIDGMYKTVAENQKVKDDEKLGKFILEDGIYGIVYGNMSKTFTIEPYQYSRKTFKAEKVKRLGRVYETSGLDTLIFNVKDFDAILIGIGDD